jgi:hypothetical protein
MTTLASWGKQRHRVWLSDRSRWRLLFRGHDALYIAAWRVRVRIFKPARRRSRDG